MKKAVENDNGINGGLPIGWEVAPVKDVCDIIRGVSYKKADSRQEAQKGYLPILRATNIQDNSLVLDKDLVYVPSTQVSDNQRLKIGDIVIATSSGSKHLVGKTAQVKEKWNGAFGAFCAAIRSTVEINYRYLGYFFSSPAYKDVIAAKAMGVNINNIRRGDIEELKIPLAPLKEQKLIGAEIEKQFSRLDEAVDNLKRVKANLKRYKASVLKAAVEGKLTEEWRKKHPDVEPADKLLERILVQRRKKWEEAELAKMKDKVKVPKDDKWKKKYKEPAKPDLKDLPVLPKEWKWVTWDTILEFDKGAFKRGPFGSSLKKSIFVDSGYKVYEQYCPINDDCSFARYYITDEKYNELKAFAVQAKDFLISCSGVTLGRITQVPDDYDEGVINQALLRVRLNNNIFDDSFFIMLFRSPYFQKQIFKNATGSAIPNVKGVNELKAIPLPLPIFKEQTEIVAMLEEYMSFISEIDRQVDKNLKRANRLRQSILKKAFSGNILKTIDRKGM